MDSPIQRQLVVGFIVPVKQKTTFHLGASDLIPKAVYHGHGQLCTPIQCTRPLHVRTCSTFYYFRYILEETSLQTTKQ